MIDLKSLLTLITSFLGAVAWFLYGNKKQELEKLEKENLEKDLINKDLINKDLIQNAQIKKDVATTSFPELSSQLRKKSRTKVDK